MWNAENARNGVHAQAGGLAPGQVPGNDADDDQDMSEDSPGAPSPAAARAHASPGFVAVGAPLGAPGAPGPSGVPGVVPSLHQPLVARPSSRVNLAFAKNRFDKDMADLMSSRTQYFLPHAHVSFFLCDRGQGTPGTQGTQGTPGSKSGAWPTATSVSNSNSNSNSNAGFNPGSGSGGASAGRGRGRGRGGGGGGGAGAGAGANGRALHTTLLCGIEPLEGAFRSAVWRFRIELPDTYPFHPPWIHAVTPIFHPNVDPQSGRVSLPLLTDDWVPVLTLRIVLLGLVLLFVEPNLDAAVNAEAAALARRGDAEGFMRRVAECRALAGDEAKTHVRAKRRCEEAPGPAGLLADGADGGEGGEGGGAKKRRSVARGGIRSGGGGGNGGGGNFWAATEARALPGMGVGAGAGAGAGAGVGAGASAQQARRGTGVMSMAMDGEEATACASAPGVDIGDVGGLRVSVPGGGDASAGGDAGTGPLALRSPNLDNNGEATDASGSQRILVQKLTHWSLGSHVTKRRKMH